MKYYIIAGEASGDLHASNLMKAISQLDKQAVFRCWGGDLMKSSGGTIVKHYRELAFMGFAQVVTNIRTIIRNLNFCKKDILSFQPDALILVDYPGFNLRISDFAHRAGFKVIYYISPQVWAWKQSRVHKIKRSVDKMLVILPFEQEFYKKYNYDVEFVGHPLLDVIRSSGHASVRQDFIAGNLLSGKPIIALLPGSRKQELHHMLPFMARLSGRFPDYEFVIAGAPSIDPEYYQKLVGTEGLKVLFNQTYELLRHSQAALVTSGTATLETALHHVPQVVCYRGSLLEYIIVRPLVKIKFISLVNLIVGRQIVKELIQYDLNEDNLYHELEMILNETWRKVIFRGYEELHGKLGGEGASVRAAESIFHFFN